MNIINKELIKMLELMNKHSKINRYIWFISISAVFIAVLYLLPNILKALAEYQQAIG